MKENINISINLKQWKIEFCVVRRWPGSYFRIRKKICRKQVPS